MVRLRHDLRPTDVWTYWHGEDPAYRLAGFSGCDRRPVGQAWQPPRNVRQSDLLGPRTLNFFYAMSKYSNKHRCP